MLYAEIARKFITKLTAYTKYNINIMDEKGIIIASRNPERIGTFHEAAFDIIANNKEIVQVSSEDRMIGTRPGVNLPLLYQNQVIGVIGVTGDPDEVQPIALVVKMSMETMMEYEYQREQTTRRQSQKEHFVYQLINGNSEDISELKAEAAALNYSEKPMRIPILIHFEEETDTDEILRQIKADELHTCEDISLASKEGEILIFKCLPERPEIFSDYKFLIGEYFHHFLMRAQEESLSYRFFIGSIQDQFRYYVNSYRHCRWLEKVRPGTSRGLFFYDYVDEYMRSIVPEIEYHHIFNCYKKRMDSKCEETWLETIDVLQKHNYNMVSASRELFIHKNTLAFRLDKVKNRFNVNPVRNAKDREFMKYLLHYLKNTDKQK